MEVSSLDFLRIMLVVYQTEGAKAWTQDEQDFLSTPVLN